MGLAQVEQFTPLPDNVTHAGPAVDLTILSLHLVGAPSLIGAINSTTTIVNARLGGIPIEKSTFVYLVCPCGSYFTNSGTSRSSRCTHCINHRSKLQYIVL
jgi:hypothetical protein